jgi:hypothetical protein
MTEELRVVEVPLTAEEKKQLFAAYATLVGEELQKEKELEDIRVQKSMAVAEIAARIGRGPFEWQGEVVTVAKRNETFYFRSRGKTEVEKIA